MEPSEAEKRPPSPTDSDADKAQARPHDYMRRALGWDDDDVTLIQPKRPRPSAAQEKAGAELLREEAEKQRVRVIEEEPLPGSGTIIARTPEKP